MQVAIALTGRGTVPLPTGLTVSIASLPSSVAGMAGGALAGAAVGAVFGALTVALATTPLFQNPIVAIVPRVCIGPVAAWVYRLTRGVNESLAFALAGAFGAIVNTGLVLGLATVLTGPAGAPYVAPGTAWGVAGSTIPAEAAVAALVALVAGHALKLSR